MIIILAIPPTMFNDRPDYQRLSGSNEVRLTHDDDGNTVYTVKISRLKFPGSFEELEEEAREKLRSSLNLETLEINRAEPVEDSRGVVAAFAFWVEK